MQTTWNCFMHSIGSFCRHIFITLLEKSCLNTNEELSRILFQHYFAFILDFGDQAKYFGRHRKAVR